MSNVSNNSPENPEVGARELISVCRQIGGMMEAGVDILRVTRVLRAQTKNPRLLEWFDQFDHELTMGRGLPEALAQAPDLFSPFAISLVRQGEERNDLAGAFLRVADFLAKEHESDARDVAANAPQVLAGQKTLMVPTSRAENRGTTADFARENVRSESAISENADRWWRRANWLGAGVLGAVAISEALVAAGWVDARWGRVAKSALSAGVLGALALAKSAPTEMPVVVDPPLNLSDDPVWQPETAEENLPWKSEEPEALPKRSVQRAPGWSDEIDTTRRIGKPPRDEEDFD